MSSVGELHAALLNGDVSEVEVVPNARPGAWNFSTAYWPSQVLERVVTVVTVSGKDGRGAQPPHCEWLQCCRVQPSSAEPADFSVALPHQGRAPFRSPRRCRVRPRRDASRCLFTQPDPRPAPGAVDVSRLTELVVVRAPGSLVPVLPLLCFAAGADNGSIVVLGGAACTHVAQSPATGWPLRVRGGPGQW